MMRFFRAVIPVLLTLQSVGATAAVAGAIDDIKKRGAVVCGVSEGVPGFSAQGEGGAWAGLDVDFCRALAAAVLGDVGKVKIVPTSSNDRFKELAAGNVDVLTRNTSWTMERELAQGISFPGVLYFDGQGFMVPRELGLSSPNQLNGARICVLSGTTSEANAAAYFAKIGLSVELMPFPHRKEAIDAYEAGSCDARTADRSALFGEMQLLADPSRHMVLAATISKELLGPAVRSGDPAWSDAVRWVLASLIHAEELGLSRATLQSADPELGPEQARFVLESGKLGVKLGLPADWVEYVIRGVGNYAEMFDRNLGKESALGMTRGVNALWRDGGLMYAPPMP